MGVRQTRIFVPSDEPDEDWAETLMGRLLVPQVRDFADALEWFWFSRYGSAAEESGDCEIGQIPDAFKRPATPDDLPRHRSLRFRYAIAEAEQERFERSLFDRITAFGYAISDFRSYDHVADTGNERFLGQENSGPGRERIRATLVTQYYMAICRLVLDTLVGPDILGRYRCERNDDLRQNPTGSPFESLHHMFCNISRVPTDIYVFRKSGLQMLGFGTLHYPPPAPPGGWDESEAYPVWF